MARFVTQSRMASLTASLSVHDPELTGMTCNAVRQALGNWWESERAFAYLRTEHLNPEDIQRLPSHVFRTHVDDTVEAESSTDGCGCYAVLACTCLCDDSFFTQTSCE